MKKYCKKAGSVIAVLLLFCFAAGCGKPAPESDEGATDEAEASFYGKNFYVLQSEYNVANSAFNSPLCFPEGSNTADLMNTRIKDFESAFECSVNFETSPLIGFCDKVALLNISSVKEYDIYITSNGGYPDELAEAGCLVPLTEVSDIIDLSLTDKYGTRGELAAATVNSVPYAVTPAALPGKQNFGTVPIGVFNEGFIKDNNLTDIREHLENRTWTWDTFRDCLREYTVTDGENTVRAFALTNFVFLNAAMLSNGTEFIIKDQDGYKSGINSPNTTEAIDFHREILTDYSDCIIDNKIVWCNEYKALADNTAVMTLLGAWSIVSDLPYNVEQYGLYPFPWGPHGEYGVSRALSDGILALMIPVIAEDAGYAATLISELLEPFPGYETKDDLVAYYDNIFFDTRDAELYLSFADNIQFSYFNRGGYDFSNAVGAALKRATATELIQTYASVMDEVVEKYIAPNGDFLLGQS